MMFFIDWIDKIQNYDVIRNELSDTFEKLEDERRKRSEALDLCGRLEDELKAIQKENDALSYQLTRRNEPNEKQVKRLKGRIEKSKARADQKLRAKLKEKQKEIEKLKAELERAQRLEWQYNMEKCRWEPVHGSLRDIQKFTVVTANTED